MEPESFIQIEIIWKDEHMIELGVVASNGRFLGTTEVYDSRENLGEFTQNITNFSVNNEQNLFYKAGETNGCSLFSMKFYSIDMARHTAVQVEIEEKVPTEFRKEEKHQVKMEINFEINDLLIFQKQLEKIIKNESGVAKLKGIKKHPYNQPCSKK